MLIVLIVLSALMLAGYVIYRIRKFIRETEQEIRDANLWS
jgi:cell division protein FtsL